MIPIIYEEPHFLLVNKPAALFSQAAGQIDSLQSRLIQQLKGRDNHPGEPFVGLPHRLDRGTSGIMLIARNQRALKRFGEQFQSRKVVKHYLAVVEGDFPDQLQRWVDFLRKVTDQPLAEVVSSDTEGAKQALANAICLAREAGTSLLSVQLETGRMHQIRAQAAARGFPIVGDAAYGAKRLFAAAAIEHPTAAAPAEEHAHPPIPLHAWSLEFRHPQSAKPMRFTASIPVSWGCLPKGIFARAKQLDQSEACT